MTLTHETIVYTLALVALGLAQALLFIGLRNMQRRHWRLSDELCAVLALAALNQRRVHEAASRIETFQDETIKRVVELQKVCGLEEKTENETAT